jgi:hypothetical protein
MVRGLNNKKEQFTYFAKLLYLVDMYGTHKYLEESQNELSKQMIRLHKMNIYTDILVRDKCLDRIRILRKSKDSLDDWQQYFSKYMILRNSANTYVNNYNEKQNLCKRNIKYIPELAYDSLYWGCDIQLKAGAVITSTLNNRFEMDPVFGALLYPACGYTCDGSVDDAMVLHRICHSAGGYLYNYHGVGPGYNYLKTIWTCFSTNKQLSGNITGLTFWLTHVQSFKEAKIRYGLTESSDSDIDNDSN